MSFRYNVDEGKQIPREAVVCVELACSPHICLGFLLHGFPSAWVSFGDSGFLPRPILSAGVGGPAMDGCPLQGGSRLCPGLLGEALATATLSWKIRICLFSLIFLKCLYR